MKFRVRFREARVRYWEKVVEAASPYEAGKTALPGDTEDPTDHGWSQDYEDAEIEIHLDSVEKETA